LEYTTVTDNLDLARHLLANAKNVVSFSGAGLSAESGIATFRDPEGVWKQVDPTVYASPQGFRARPTEVSDWYAARRRTLAQTTPNDAHHALARSGWQRHITQNVDDLLERAGARDVVHLHGTLDSDRCQDNCGYVVAVDLAQPPSLGACPDCGAMLRPNVVWFGEMLPPSAWAAAESAIQSADVAVVIGTSAEVWPAAGLIAEAQQVISVNTEPTAAGRRATVELIGSAASVVPKLVMSAGPSTP
jgi:NAD-dependent deacetylase